MNLWDIVKTVGSGLVSTMVPGGALIVGAVNAMLPDDQKLPEHATGIQVQTAVASMSSEDQASIMIQQFDVKKTDIKERHASNRAMLEAEAISPHTTRPYIAKHAFHVIAIVVLVVVGFWGYGIYKSPEEDIVLQVTSGWPFILSVIGPFVILLHAYFGVLKQEQRQKLEAANGQLAPASLFTAIKALVGK